MVGSRRNQERCRRTNRLVACTVSSAARPRSPTTTPVSSKQRRICAYPSALPAVGLVADDGAPIADDSFYVALNGTDHDLAFALPDGALGTGW